MKQLLHVFNIYELAVKTKFQRQEIGQQLIKSINDYCCQQQGIAEVLMQAEEEADEYAVEFYRKTGGKEMNVVQFSYGL